VGAPCDATQVSTAWLEGGGQPELEAALNLGFGFPAVVLFNTAKQRYAVMRQAYGEAGLTAFVDGLFAGAQTTEPLPKDGDLREFLRTTTPWDGKDAPKVEEEPDDDEDMAFLKELQEKAERDSKAAEAEADAMYAQAKGKEKAAAEDLDIQTPTLNDDDL
jgi:hypothetical protein